MKLLIVTFAFLATLYVGWAFMGPAERATVKGLFKRFALPLAVIFVVLLAFAVMAFNGATVQFL